MPASPQPKRPAAPGNGRSQLEKEANGQSALPASVIDLRVARRIRARRLWSGMTLQTLAQGIGVAFQQAHKYERGQSRISAGRLFHVAKALGAPISYFFLPDEEAEALEDDAVKHVAMNSERQGSSRSTNKSGFLRDRRGAVAALVAATMTVLFGFAGLGVDVGIWYTLKRQSQSAADNAAISGAIELVDGKGVSGGPATTDVQNLAMYAARNNLSASAASSLTVDSRSSQAYPNGCTAPAGNNICVNNPPNLGVHAGDTNYVEAILAQPAVSIFPGLVGYSDAITIRTRAVAGYRDIPSCFVGLGNPYGTGNTLAIGGGGNNVDLNIPNCAFVSASTNATATSNASIYLNGGITINAGAISTSGGYVIKGNSASVTPPIVANVSPQYKDPYCDATESASACPNGTAVITLASAGYPWSPTQLPPPLQRSCSTGGGGVTTPLQPGWYGGSVCAGTAPMNFSSGSNTYLCPGVYFLDGEQGNGTNKGAAFIVSDNGTTVNMGTAGANGCPANGLDGVTVIATCNTVASANCKGGGFIIGGQGSNTPTVNLSPPSTSPGCSWLPQGCPGIPAKILFHQVFGTADTSNGNTSFGTILGASGLDGLIHVPATTITLKGGSTFGSCIEMIAAAFTLSGGATLSRASTCPLQSDKAKVISLVE